MAQQVSGSVAEALKVDLPVNVPDAEHFEGIHKPLSSLLHLGISLLFADSALYHLPEYLPLVLQQLQCLASHTRLRYLPAWG